MPRPSPTHALPVAAQIAVLLLLAGSARAQYAVSQLPVLSNASAPTNVVMMMDDSGSMQWAYVPDSNNQYSGTRRFLAANFNPLAYNPQVVYPAPSMLDGINTTPLTTSFTAASIDGFNASLGTINLSSGYEPTASYQPGGSQQVFAPHPSQDLALIGVTTASAGGGANGNGNGGGNQFGPGSGSNTAVPAAAYFYVYDSTQTIPAGSTQTALCSAPNTVATDATAAPNDDNCYKYVKVTSTTAPIIGNVQIDGLQNFANWYSFYRTRHLMVVSAAALAMADPGLAQARVTWRALNSCTEMVTGQNCAGWDGVKHNNQLRTFTGAQVNSFYQWLAHLPAAQPTPTRSTWTYIGDYFSTPSSTNTALGTTALGANGPYGINPNPLTGTAPAGEVACAQNFNITLTDGQWNQDSNTAGAYFGQPHKKKTTLPDGTVFLGTSTAVPYALYSNDNNADTLSAVAFHYWETNLRPDLPNSSTAVKPYMPIVTPATFATGVTPTTVSGNDYWNPQNDPATWPHLVQITIGLGMTGTMTTPGLPWWGNTWGPSTITAACPPPNTPPPPGSPPCQYRYDSTLNAGYYNLWNGIDPWPAINNSATQGDQGKAYDLWHSAVASRGMAFSAESPPDLIAAFNTGLARVTQTSKPGTSAVATNSASLNTGSVVYQASYDPSDWHGALSAKSFAGGVISSTPIWQTVSTSIAPASARVVLTSGLATAPTNGFFVGDGIQFSSTDTTFSSIWNALWTTAPVPWAPAAQATNILNWVRGDQSNEVPAAAGLRARATTVLGDIVDSAPVFAWHENYGYGALPEGAASTPNYSAFLSTKANSTGAIYQGQGMLYVGANDGMLHGFDASSGGGGKEVFGYVPNSVIANLPALANPAYAHQFYVDQTPYVGDACLGGAIGGTPLTPVGCTWKTLLVGATGAGGRGVFALDVTQPSTMEGASPTSNVKWDLVGQPAAGANGDPDLGFTIGKPTIARLNNGHWVAIFGNGYLSTRGCAVLFIVSFFDNSITKIDTSGLSSTATCTSANVNAANGLGPVTLFSASGGRTTDFVYAGDMQGNLWKFDLTLTTSGTLALGHQLLFAASPNCASAPTTCQPITSAPVYGPALPGLTGTMLYFGTGRLFAVGDGSTTSTQSFYAILDNGSSTTVSSSALVPLTVTDNGTGAGATRSITGNAVTSSNMGWFMNLPDTGERVTLSPLLTDGFVLFATVVPNASSCTGAGSGWLMAVSATTATIGGQNFFMAGTGVDGLKSTVGMIEGFTQILDSTNSKDIILVGGTSGIETHSRSVTIVKGRISWHELTR
jgi:type IV pilus assembly protein PilY1